MEGFPEGFTMRWTAKQEARMNDLFRKYGQDYSDVGDEIDLATGDIIVNNGHIEGMRHERDAGDRKNPRRRQPTASSEHRTKILSNRRPPVKSSIPDILPVRHQAPLPPCPLPAPVHRPLPAPVHRPRKRSASPDDAATPARWSQEDRDVRRGETPGRPSLWSEVEKDDNAPTKRYAKRVKWTPEKDKRLWELYVQKTPWKEVAKEMGEGFNHNQVYNRWRTQERRLWKEYGPK